MLALWLTLTVTLAWSLTSARCPERCSCGSGDELEYSCALDSATLTITARLRDYLNIDCEGGALTCSDFPSLPIAGNRSLPSLSIRECSLPDPLACIARRIDATGVDLVMLKNVSTPLERRHLEGLGSGVLIMFNAESQTSIPSDALSALPTLHHFRLCGGDVTLTGDDFRHAPPLTYLELATDHITSLPADAFRGLDQLKTLNIWKNNISDISEHAFRGLFSVEELYMSSAGVRSVPRRVFSHTVSLHTLALERNSLHTLPAGLLQPLHMLRQVTISNDVPLTIEPFAFANLTLTSLKLDRSSITTLPPHMLHNTTSLVNFTISHNTITRLPAEVFEGLKSLERLDLSYNRVQNVSNKLFLGLKALKELKMDGNLLEELPEQLFSGLRHLEVVSITSNRLHYIHPECFQGASVLHLSLSHNNLSLSTPVTPQYYNLEEYSPFNNLLKLRSLKLSGNKISTMFYDWRYVLLDLEELDLKYNSFVELTSADLHFLSSEITVDLRHNNITTLYLAPDTTHHEDHSPSSVLLDGNPLHCDCRLYELARRLRGASSPHGEPSLVLDEAYCASPPQLQGLQFSKVGLDEFVCDVDCSCECQIRPYIDALDLTCTNASNIPDPREYQLSHSILKLREMPRNLSVLPDYVSVLNLSHLGLTSVPHMPASLEFIDLSNNKLEEFPVELLSRNVSLKLSGNLFFCDCSTVNNMAVMNKYSYKIVDWQSVKCGDGSYLWRVEVESLCVVQRAALLGGVLAAVGLVLALVAVLLHRYSLEIRIFLTNRGLCFTHHYDASKLYDVFVSFAHDDENFVIEKLLPKLEMNYKVCVHHRDWKVGDLIPAQIARSVEESRRTLIVLSRHFLASTWGMLEFRAAHVQAARENTVRVVVLLLEDLTDVEIDAELRAYLTTNTYIKWGDQWFWEKLYFALPKRTKAKDVRSDQRARLAADNMAKGGLHVTLTPDGKLVNTALNKNVI